MYQSTDHVVDLDPPPLQRRHHSTSTAKASMPRLYHHQSNLLLTSSTPSTRRPAAPSLSPQPELRLPPLPELLPALKLPSRRATAASPTSCTPRLPLRTLPSLTATVLASYGGDLLRYKMRTTTNPQTANGITTTKKTDTNKRNPHTTYHKLIQAAPSALNFSRYELVLSVFTGGLLTHH